MSQTSRGVLSFKSTWKTNILYPPFFQVTSIDYNDEIEQLPDVVSQTKKIALQGRRLSVSVERVDPSKLDAKAAVVPKTEDQSRRLEESIARVEENLFIYSRLSEKQKSDVKAAMFEQRVPRGTDIIVQGTEGDYFYIIESGMIFSSEILHFPQLFLTFCKIVNSDNFNFISTNNLSISKVNSFLSPKDFMSRHTAGTKQ